MHLTTFPTALLLLQGLQHAQARFPDFTMGQAPIPRTQGQPCQPGYPESDPLDIRSEYDFFVFSCRVNVH